MPDTFAIRMSDSAEAHLVVGMKILIEPVGVGDRFASRLIGWSMDKYLLLHLPAKGAARDHVYDGKKLVVRYISCDGLVCGFETVVQGAVYSPQRLLFVDYPRRIAVHSIRSGPRIGVFLGGEISVGQAVAPCHVLNISLSGCQAEVCVNEPAALALATDALVTVGFRLPDLDANPYRLQGTIARLSDQPGGQFRLCGVRFTDVPDAERQGLERYIAQAQQHLGAACTFSQGQ
jgi:c-di-GMP-binding flagellar brake protein YcgR